MSVCDKSIASLQPYNEYADSPNTQTRGFNAFYGLGFARDDAAGFLAAW